MLSVLEVAVVVDCTSWTQSKNAETAVENRCRSCCSLDEEEVGEGVEFEFVVSCRLVQTGWGGSRVAVVGVPVGLSGKLMRMRMLWRRRLPTCGSCLLLLAT